MSPTTRAGRPAPLRAPPPRPRASLALAAQRQGDRGSGTVLAVGLVGVLAALLVAGLLVAAVALAGQQARTAADVTALAVVGRVVEGSPPDAACAAGVALAARHGAGVESCRVTTGVEGLPRAEVAVVREVDGTPWEARARASAGAVPARDGGAVTTGTS